MNDVDLPFVPAPWTLTGRAWIAPQLQRAAEVAPFVPPQCSIVALGGWTPGGYLCVDYATSPVGPYREMIFVPALVRHGRHVGFHVSHIYVDSPASVAGGRGNWWLPKALLQLDLQQHDQTTIFKARHDQHPVATGFFTATRAPRFPITNRRWPLALLQARADHLRRSSFWATARIEVINGMVYIHDQARLPRLATVVRLPLLAVSPFRLTFEPGVPIAAQN